MNKNKVLNANIKFTIGEIEHLIIALVIAERASESLSSMEFSKVFESLRKDIVKIKHNLIEKGETNGSLEKSEALLAEVKSYVEREQRTFNEYK